MSIINHILSHMHGCAKWCHEKSLTLSIDNWLNAICHCQCHFPHSDLHFYQPDMHFCESHLSIHHKLPYWQHSLQPHSEGESLPPLYAHGMLMCTKDCGHPEESTMVSKQMLDNIHLLPFFLTFKKMQTQHWLHQSITHLSACSKNMLFLLAQHIDAQLSQKMPIA